MDSVVFGTALVATARKYLYVRETAGPNMDGGGPIDKWLAAVGCAPGASWCAAAACGWVHETAQGLNVTVNWHNSASALALISRNPSFVVKDPTPGAFIVWDHGHGLGHIALLTDVVSVNGVPGGLMAIAGNTSPDGKSREGTGVFEHDVTYPDARIAGYLLITPQ
jgi:hypothetical protein